MTVRQQLDRETGTIGWYTSNLITTPHAMFCRCGGVSPHPYTSLNLSFGVGDNQESVTANRQRVKQLLAIDYLVSARQVHGNDLVIAEDIDQDTMFNNADAIITSQPGIGLLIQQADCQAILLHDPEQGVIGAIHNGWRGSRLNIIAKTVAVMQDRYAVRPTNLRAVISPSLGPCCAEFINFQQELPEAWQAWQVRPCYFDFWEISRYQLRETGLKNKHIETTGVCTVCNSKDFFSYRRAVKHGNSQTGRNGSVIALTTFPYL